MSYAFGCTRRPLALQAQSRRVRSLEGDVAFINPTFYRAETEALDAPNVPPVELVLRQAAGLLLEAYHVINGIWSNYRDSKAPRLFLVPGLRFLRREEREGRGKVVRRWQTVGKSSLARPAPWNAGLHFYTVRLKGFRYRVHICPRFPT